MRVLALANLYRADHAAQVDAYRPLNPAASSWNSALFGEMSKLDVDLDVVQFWPIRRARRFSEGRTTYHYLPRVPQIDGFTSLLKRARVAALVRDLKPDVVHGIGSEHGYAWAAVGHGVPSVITIHGYLKIINSLDGHASFLRERFLVREEQLALHRADRVIAINEFMRDKFVADGCPIERTTVVPNALNPVFLQQWDEPKQRSIDIIMVGTLHPLKNQHVALELFARLARDHGLRPQVRIVGGATTESRAYHEGLLRQHAEAKLDHVQFVGKKSPSELFELYRNGRFLLHISEFEADPTVVAEALACGVLPVVNPVAGLAYRVQDGRNGWHLPILDPQVAASRLAMLLARDGDRARLASAGRQLVVKERMPKAVAAATADNYHAMIAMRF